MRILRWLAKAASSSFHLRIPRPCRVGLAFGGRTDRSLPTVTAQCDQRHEVGTGTYYQQYIAYGEKDFLRASQRKGLFHG